MSNPPYPLSIRLTNQDNQAPSEVCISLPSTSVSEFVTVAWGDGTSNVVYGGVGNRIAHSYGNPSRTSNMILTVTGDAKTISFYDASGDRPIGRLNGWGDYVIGKVIMPDNSIVLPPSQPN